ncbi:MAG TPA: tRNA (5-methylaminomethyl-2-thiouridine)(34)-methyltransferase MnmD [Chryseosolibacter sp.]
MPDDIQIITTGDGSHSLLNTALNETYHSVHGAKRESIHVFIKQGLEYFLERKAVDTVKIFEVGFGTGLNALLTANFAQQHHQKISYTSIEAFPLDETIWKKLNYTESSEDTVLFQRLHTATWQAENLINDFFSLTKLETTLQEVSPDQNVFDVVYFDAFAPSKQPELWEIEMLQKVFGALKPNGVFVTYCAKGQLKRDLKTIGFLVETLAGPPGKKEMVRALKNS